MMAVETGKSIKVGASRAVAKEDSQTRPVAAAVVREKLAENWTNIGQKMGLGQNKATCAEN